MLLSRGSLPLQQPKLLPPSLLHALAATSWCRLRCEAARIVSNLGAMARAACGSGREHFDGCVRVVGATSTFVSTASGALGRGANLVLAFGAPSGIVCSFDSRLFPPTPGQEVRRHVPQTPLCRCVGLRLRALPA